MDLAKLEQGLRQAEVPLKASKEALKESDPAKGRSYLLGVWQRRRQQLPELDERYASKLTMAQKLLAQWVEAHPGEQKPVTFDNWYTQPAFCRYLDQTLKLAYVGTLAGDDKVNLKTGQGTLAEFAASLKEEHFQAEKTGGKPVFRPITISFKGTCETYCLETANTRCFTGHLPQCPLSGRPVQHDTRGVHWPLAAMPVER